MSRVTSRRLHMGCGESLQQRRSPPAPLSKVKGASPGPAKPPLPATRAGERAR